MRRIRPHAIFGEFRRRYQPLSICDMVPQAAEQLSVSDVEGTQRSRAITAVLAPGQSINTPPEASAYRILFLLLTAVAKCPEDIAIKTTWTDGGAVFSVGCDTRDRDYLKARRDQIERALSAIPVAIGKRRGRQIIVRFEPVTCADRLPEKTGVMVYRDTLPRVYGITQVAARA